MKKIASCVVRILGFAIIMTAFPRRGHAETPASIDELPLVIPDDPPAGGSIFAIFASGDGGWSQLTREVAQRLAAADVPVVGWNLRAYLWRRKDPATAAQDLSNIIRHFSNAWGRSRVVLIGYSRGADIIPFMVNRMSDADRTAIAQIVLIGNSRATAFEFHLTDFLSGPNPKIALAVLPEIERLRQTKIPVLTIVGAEDGDAPIEELKTIDPGAVLMPGGHHFQKDFDGLAKIILRSLRPGSP